MQCLCNASQVVIASLSSGTMCSKAALAGSQNTAWPYPCLEYMHNVLCGYCYGYGYYSSTVFCGVRYQVG
jgi:hypothetical protein